MEYESIMNGTLSIKVTPEDADLLPELERFLGEVMWASGDRINSDLTRRYIANVPIYLYIKRDCVYYGATSSISYVDLPVLLQYKPLEVNEIDIDDILKE